MEEQIDKPKRTRRKKPQDEARIAPNISIANWDGKRRLETLKQLASERYNRKPEEFTKAELDNFSRVLLYEILDEKEEQKREETNLLNKEELDEYRRGLLEDIERAGVAILPVDVEAISLRYGLKDGVCRTHQQVATLLGITRQNAEQKVSRGLRILGRKPGKQDPELSGWSSERVLEALAQRGEREDDSPKMQLALKALQKMFEGDNPQSYRRVAAYLHISSKSARLLVHLAISELEAESHS